MQYSSLLVAVAAVVGLVGAQNATLPAGIQACCSVDANTVPTDQKTEWCRASTNTCPELCGGQGQVASGGNDCNSQTLVHTCECRNGTKPNLALYEQTVEGQECRYWYSGCINATNQDAGLQFTCTQIRDSQCGNLTSGASTTSSSSASVSGATRTSSTGSATGAATASASSTPNSAAIAFDAVREYGTPLLAGGLAAAFGLAL